MNYEKTLNKLAQDIVNYDFTVREDKMTADKEEDFEVVKNDLEKHIDGLIREFEHELVYTQPDVLQDWSDFYTCKSPVQILNDLREFKKSQPEKEVTKTEPDLSERGQKLKEIKLMDKACRSLNDEDYTMEWLYGGVPDGATEEDYEWFVDEEGEFDRAQDLFIKLMRAAAKDDSGLYECDEEAYKYAKKFVPDLKNWTLNGYTQEEIKYESKELKKEEKGLYGHCYDTSDREELKEIALNGIYVANDDISIIAEVNERLNWTDEYKEELKEFSKAPYDYVANNYYNMPLELLREIALDAVYIANDDEAIQKEIDDRKIEESVDEEIEQAKEDSKEKGLYTESKTLEDIQMDIYEAIQLGRKMDNQTQEENIVETIKNFSEEYPEINKSQLVAYITKKAEEIYAGEYDDVPTQDYKDLDAELDRLIAADATDKELNDFLEEASYNEVITNKEYEALVNKAQDVRKIDVKEEDCTQAGAIAGPTAVFGVKDKKEEVEEKDLSKDLLGNEAEKRQNDADEALEKYLNFAREIKEGDNDTITLDSAKQLLRDAYIKAKCYYSFEPEEIDRRLAKDYPDLFGNEIKTESEGDKKVNKEVDINGYRGTLYSQDEIDCFDAIARTIKGLEKNVTNWNVSFFPSPKAYVDFTTDDGEGTFEVIFSTDTFGTVEKVETRYSNQNITYDFIKLAEELYNLKKFNG